MKYFLILLFFFSFVESHALPLGNPAEPALLRTGVFNTRRCNFFSLRFGFYGDYVFNRYLETKIVDTNFRSRKSEIYTNSSYLSVNIGNRLDLFATLGTSQINFIFVPDFSSIIGAKVEIDTQTNFSWSVGLRAIAMQWCGFTLGVEGQYFENPSNLDSVFISGIQILFPFDEVNVKYKEWQAGIGISYRINIAANGLTAFVPYIGYKASGVDFLFGDTELSTDGFSLEGGSFDLRNRRTYGGYAFGVTLVGCSRASVTAEARFIDEKAFYINGQFRF